MLNALDCSPCCGAWTGIGRYVRDLCHGLAHDDAAPLGVYQGHRGALDPELAEHCRALARYDLLGGRIGAALRLPRVLRDHGATLYHSTGTIAVPRGWDGIVVGTVHDLFPLDPDCVCPPRQRRLFRQILDALLARCQAIICPSAWTAAQLRDYGWRGRCEVIHHGLRAAGPTPPRPSEAPERYLLSIGAIEARKGLDLLARAGCGDDERPWFHIGPVRDDRGAALRERMRAAGCRLLGWQTPEHCDAWLAHATLLLQPSRAEGFGYVPLEAMQRGVPVIARDAATAREVLGDAAILLGDDAASWRARIGELLDDEDRRGALAEAGRAHAAGFDIGTMARRHLALYRELDGAAS